MLVKNVNGLKLEIQGNIRLRCVKNWQFSKYSRLFPLKERNHLWITPSCD